MKLDFEQRQRVEALVTDMASNIEWAAHRIVYLEDQNAALGEALRLCAGYDYFHHMRPDDRELVESALARAESTESSND